MNETNTKSDAKSEFFAVDDPVRWKWMGGYVDGVVVEIFFEPTVKTIKGKNIKRNGSPEKPAYLVRSDAGNLALKLITELEAGSAVKPPWAQKK